MAIAIANLSDTIAGVKCCDSTLLGSPFLIESENQRDPYCDAFAEYMARMLVEINPNPSTIAFYTAKKYGLRISPSWNRPFSGAIFLKELEGLQRLARKQDLVLLCDRNCLPKRCHLETIKAWLD
jgi:hypothetical protein